MNDTQERKLDKFKREQVFYADSAADFASATAGAMMDKAALIAEIERLAAEQISGFDDKRQAFDRLENARDNVEEDLEQINFAARAADDELENLAAKFRLPYRFTDETLMATARSFQTDASPHRAAFVELGLPDDFLVDLANDIAAFETAANASDSALEEHAQATGALNDSFRRGMEQSKKQDAVVRIKYRNAPGKLAAWTVASHLERAPKGTGGTPTPTPTV